MDAAQNLIREEWSNKPRPGRNGRAGFTVVELLVVILMIVVLAALLLPAGGGSRKSSRTQCMSNEKQMGIALHIYANDNKEELPVNDSGSWPWDMPWNVGTILETNGSNWRRWYCPASGFGDKDNARLWNYSRGNYRILGYAMTFANTSTLAQTNWNRSIVPPPVPISGNFLHWEPINHVLLADLTISQPGQNNETNRVANTYVNIQGGYPKRFRTSHMEGAMPLGGNVAMLDGHVEWRQFTLMRVRTVGSASPVFWW